MFVRTSFRDIAEVALISELATGQSHHFYSMPLAGRVRVRSRLVARCAAGGGASVRPLPARPAGRCPMRRERPADPTSSRPDERAETGRSHRLGEIRGDEFWARLIIAEERDMLEREKLRLRHHDA